MKGNTKRSRAKGPGVQLDACARAFVFILWAKNEPAAWRAAVLAWRSEPDPLRVHLTGYPAKHLHSARLKTDHMRHSLTAAVAAANAKRLAELLRPLCELRKARAAARPIGEVLEAIEAVDLRHVRVSRKLAETVAERWGRTPPAPEDSEVAAFVDAYNGPLGKVEAAAEQFDLPMHEVAEHLTGARPSLARRQADLASRNPPSSPASLNFGALHEAQHEAARLRDENARLRSLLAFYLGGDDRGA